MEKKNSRQLQPSTKGFSFSTDSKKSQDVGGGKPWKSGSYRREPVGGSLSYKGEPSRKQTPQRNKNYVDKRPRPRGDYQSISGNQTTGLDDTEFEAELGSVFLPGSKKRSLNHLLNFYYTPREGQLHKDCFESKNSKEKGQVGIATYKHTYNKEHFLQANCQFIVNDCGDYREYLNNPDTLVDWNLIEQVNVHVSDFPSCVICLDSPVAAKMTRCGHIFCWSCMLHYFMYSEKTWQKCPICYEAIHVRDLKSVVAIPHTTFNINETITFKLMKRAKGSLVAYPVDMLVKHDSDIFGMSEKECRSVFSKLLLANNYDVLSIIERERKELEMQKLDVEDSEHSFIDAALTSLRGREETVLSAINKMFGSESLCENREMPSGENREMPSGENREIPSDENLEATFSENLSLKEQCKSPSYRENVLDDSNDSPSRQQEGIKFYYFYQAADGQHIYLHPVNAKMLEHSYGSLEYAPKSISGKILEKEGGSMTNELRKRLRYLCHLPVTCQFELAEIQLKSQVNKDTIDRFHAQLTARQKARQQRQREEKRREKRITEEENRKMGKYPVADIQLESPLQFPDFSQAQTRLHSDSENTIETLSTSPTDTTISEGIASEIQSLPGPSFASMLGSKKPVVTHVAQKPRSTAPQKYVTATGVNMTSASLPRNSNESELDYLDLPPQQKTNMGDLIAEALNKKVEMGDSCVSATASKNKKKKKKSKTVLMATNMAYSAS